MAEANVVGGIVQPNVDIVGGMKSWADLQMAQSHADLFAAQARQANMKQNALARAAQLRASGDEEGALNAIASVDPATAEQMQKFGQEMKANKARDARGKAELAENPNAKASDKAIMGQPDIQKTVAETEQTKVNTDKARLENWRTNASMLSNKAVELFAQKDRGEISEDTLKSRWNDIIAEGVKKKIISPMEWNSLHDNPDKAYVQATQQSLQSTQDYITNTGIPEANKAEAKVGPAVREAEAKAKIAVAEAKAKPANIASDSTMRVVEPNALDNLNLGYGSGGKPPNAVAAIQPGAVVPAAPAPAPAPAAPAPAAPAASNVVPSKWGDIPVTPNLAGPKEPGVIQQGMSKAVSDEMKRANDAAAKIIEMGDDAQTSLNQTSQLVSELASGRVQSDQLAPYKQKLAGWAYAIAGGGENGREAVKNVLGPEYDLASVESAQKTMTQMGLTFARQTEGAREAVAAIKIALGGQPQLITSTDGNLKIARTLESIAQYQSDRAAAIQDYGSAQAEKGQNGLHYVKFNKWWNDNHPLTEYTSKVVPLSYESPKQKFYANTIYEGKIGDKVMRGKFIGYDAQKRPQFAPVE